MTTYIIDGVKDLADFGNQKILPGLQKAGAVAQKIAHTACVNADAGIVAATTKAADKSLEKRSNDRGGLKVPFVAEPVRFREPKEPLRPSLLAVFGLAGAIPMIVVAGIALNQGANIKSPATPSQVKAITTTAPVINP
jgi:hypothetical protein